MPDHPDVELISIDGPARGGKSTVAQMVADILHFDCINTGSFYRILTDDALHHGVDWNPQALVEHLTSCHITIKRGVAVAVNYRQVTMEELKRPEIDAHIAVVSAQLDIRKHVRTQTEDYIGRVVTGAVCEGRDAGELFRWALPRVYLTASLETRASRGGTSVEEVRARDTADTERTVSPLMTRREATQSGYYVIDTDDLTPEQTARMIIKQYEYLMAPV